MAQNTVIKGRDNPVIFEFKMTGDFAANQLNTFDSITLDIGGESYSTATTPANLEIVNDNELRLKIGDTTALDPGGYIPEIVGISADYNDGYLLNGLKRKILDPVIVK